MRFLVRSRLGLAVPLGMVWLLAACTEPAGPAPTAPAPPVASGEPARSPGVGVVGETIYVPAYSHIYFRDGTREFNLATTLSVRNTDPEQPITVTSVRYHDSAGRPVRQYVDAPVNLPPLASRAFVVEDRDTAGGVGANFLVEWQAAARVSAPIVEAVMISTAGTQGLSFVSRGQVVRAFGTAAGDGEAAASAR